MKGLLSRVSGADGFQLVNVTNAPIQLGAFVCQNRLVNKVHKHSGKNRGRGFLLGAHFLSQETLSRYERRFLITEVRPPLPSQVALYNLFTRHYQRNAMVEARKILGGAGPAIATIPASLLWASISLVDLGTDVASGRVGAEVRG